MIIKNEHQKLLAFQMLAEIDLNDSAYKFSLEKIRKIRNLSQNRLYWANIGLFVYELAGGDKSMKDIFHQTFKDTYIRFENEVNESEKDKFAIIHRARKSIIIKGIEIKEPYTTTELDTKEFGKYMDLIESFANIEYQFKLLNPNDKEIERIIAFYEQYI